MASDVQGDRTEDGIVWYPSQEVRSRSRLLRFINEQRLADYDTLQERAVSEPSWYWDAVVKHLGLEWYEPYREVLDLADGLPWPRWFTGAKYNYVHDAVDKWAEGSTRERTAIIWEGDGGEQRRLT
ncbi:MAG TPA: acetyl-coenzyme A synthetase N-terminal domain-containing protein, partial [Nitrolancea sp.]|nr:acetyl-coenzyme A synthetase N-terminal domain-containing protein [Nitrolancea sp.]